MISAYNIVKNCFYNITFYLFFTRLVFDESGILFKILVIFYSFNFLNQSNLKCFFKNKCFSCVVPSPGDHFPCCSNTPRAHSFTDHPSRFLSSFYSFLFLRVQFD